MDRNMANFKLKFGRIMAIENPKKHMDLGLKTFKNSSIISGYLFKP
jgi:hypothetical protein